MCSLDSESAIDCRRSAADFCGAAGARRIARHARRPGCDRASRVALLVARPVLSPARARAIYSQDCCDIPIGDSSHDPGYVARFGAMRKSYAITLKEVSDRKSTRLN